MVSARPILPCNPRVVLVGGSGIGGSHTSGPRHAVVGLQRTVPGVPSMPGTNGVVV